MSNFLTNDHIYEELVAARRRESDLAARLAEVEAELQQTRDKLDANAHRSLAWEMTPNARWLEIKMSLDPVLLSSAYSVREVFEAAGGEMLRQLWTTYRGNRPSRSPVDPEGA